MSCLAYALHLPPGSLRNISILYSNDPAPCASGKERSKLLNGTASGFAESAAPAGNDATGIAFARRSPARKLSRNLRRSYQRSFCASVSPAEEKSVQTVTQVEEKSQQPPVTVTFENTALANIVKQIADYHHVGVSIRNAEAAKLRLYFQWNQQDALSETVDMLNRFERFSIVQAADGTLVVE